MANGTPKRSRAARLFWLKRGVFQLLYYLQGLILAGLGAAAIAEMAFGQDTFDLATGLILVFAGVSAVRWLLEERP